jgi:DNA-binding LytR/AlgR family response regulator
MGNETQDMQKAIKDLQHWDPMNWKSTPNNGTSQVTMDVEQRTSSETGKESLLHSGDPHIHVGVKFVCGELQQPLQPIASAKAHPEQSVATLGTKAADKTAEPGVGRIRAPLTRAFRQRPAGRTARLSEALPQLPALATRTSTRIAIKAKGRILFIDARDVVAVEAKGDYVLLLHRSGSHRLRESISTVEEKLNLHGFVRIHRSVLVNAALVEEIQPWSTGEYVLRVRGGSEYTVTRSYKKNLQLLAQSWIGAGGFDAERDDR